MTILTNVSADPELSLADAACLAIIGEGPTHGWRLVKLLDPEGELGRIWSLSRPLTYRSIDKLVDAGLVERTDRGRRAELRVTPSGRRRRSRWLATPVEHLRELRTEFLLKLTLCRRAGLDPATLIERQRAALAAPIEALRSAEPNDPVELWRQESATAAARFLDHLANVTEALTQ